MVALLTRFVAYGGGEPVGLCQMYLRRFQHKPKPTPREKKIQAFSSMAKEHQKLKRGCFSRCGYERAKEV